MITFYIVRHGYSLANDANVFAGRTDVPLSEIGLRQAECVSAYILNNLKIDSIYSSELQRAKQTISKVAISLNLPIITNPNFNEIWGGKWEGLSFDEINKKFSKDIYVWRNDISNSICTDGESFKELKKRTFSTLKMLAENNLNENKNILIATHAGVIRSLLSSIMNLSDEECNKIGWVTNASITTVKYKDANFTIEKISEDNFLTSLKTQLPKNI